MQNKRNQIGENGNQQPYPPQQPGPPPGQRTQPGPPGPGFFGPYPGRGPPPTPYNDGRPPQHFAGYGPPPPFTGTERDDRESRFDRSTMAPPPGIAGFPRPRASSYGHYSQQPPSFPPTVGPPPPPHSDARFDQPPRQQGPVPGPGSPRQHPPPYGPSYNVVRSHSWGNGDRTYHSGGPYTSAQRNSEGRKDVEPPKEEGGIAPFSIIGKNVPPAQPLSHVMKKPYGYHPPPVSSQTSGAPRTVDADAMAYKAVEGRDGATSPSQIESNRREDVTIMGCTCKKSKCLKLYCVCFGASVMCGVSCRCLICHNTPSHEHARKDAIRSILARNPSAFDTKFKKTAEVRTVHQAGKAITHKLGCKCRKSFCTKKYCECYNAGVKCSGSCRCVGCKNMPPGGFGNEKNGNGIAPRSFAADVNRVKNTGGKVAPHLPPTSEHKMRDAATHLAFLKHSSPVRPTKQPTGNFEATQEISSCIPSLTDSSSGTVSSSPDEETEKVSALPKAAAGVDSLLLAAYAMTELQEATATPVTPKKSIQTVPFRSPKRKSHPAPLEDQFDDADDAEFSDESDNIESDQMDSKGDRLMTPNDMRQVKRTRVGTIERNPPTTASRVLDEIDKTPRPEKPPSDSEEDGAESPGEEHPSPEESVKGTSMMTPKTTKKSAAAGGLTPVTARCIDFQHMGMTETVDMDEKKEDITTA